MPIAAFECIARNYHANITYRFRFPPFRYLAEGRVHHLDLLVAGEAELDEPFPVEGLGHLLQYLDAPQIVLNQVVVGGEDGGDFVLDRRVRGR